MSKLTHVDGSGKATMVDVGDKAESVRVATAQAFIYLNKTAMTQVIEQTNKKGDVLSTARIAGIMAAKKCADLIPLCHPLMLSKVDVDFTLEPKSGRIKVNSLCKLTGKTGVEMEALTAVNIAALTLYDMCKAVDKDMRIENVCVTSKSGGKSVDWTNEK
jgi:cyclic pyranopterin monophosphate synthase